MLLDEGALMIGFDTEYVPDEHATPAPADFKNLGGFLIRLRDAADPISRFIKGRLPGDLVAKIDSFKEQSGEPTKLTVPKPMQDAVIVALSEIISGPVYDLDRFATVTLAGATKRLLAMNPEKASQIRLNRQLLEAAFPEEIKFGEPNRNRILSYQYCAIDRKGKSWMQLVEPTPGKRITLKRFLTDAIRTGKENGHIADWPKVIHLVGHFTMADIPGFKDFLGFRRLFDALRRTFVTMEKPAELQFAFTKGHAHSVKIYLRDTMLLAPQGESSLKKLGEVVGLSKLPLEKQWIENMDLLHRDDPNRFEDYALRDAEVCVAYALKMMQLRYRICPEKPQTDINRADSKPKAKAVPATLSAIGLAYLQNLWERDSVGIDRLKLMGVEEKTERIWHPTKKQIIPDPREVPIPIRYFQELLATECYHGGRNEQFIFGAGERGEWNDFDLRGAYPTAMALVGHPKWEEIRITTDPTDLEPFQPTTLGYAHVSFSFPQDTRFPCLPVRTAFGLIFPLKGQSCCCAPEIYLAARMGATLRINYGAILPVEDQRKPFLPFVSECTEKRKRAKQAGSRIEEMLWKEMANSTYGKTAQGLREKRCFDTRTGDSRPLPPSAITNPFMAAFVTSFIRAALGEVLWKLPAHVTVCNATTDGFLSTATEAEAMAAASSEICNLFSEARRSICGDPRVLERKRRIARPLGWRTRGQATLEPFPGETKLVLAKAGLKPVLADDVDEGNREKAENDWIIESFIHRTGKSSYLKRASRSFREVYGDSEEQKDWMTEEIESRLSMEFDWKRKPHNPSLRPIRGAEHLAFETQPWESVAEHAACRERWESYNKNSRKVLKRVEDLRAFEVYQQKDRRRPELNRKGGVLGYAVRMVLNAYKGSRCGLGPDELSCGDLAGLLTRPEFPVTIDQVKRANAEKFEPNRVPRLAEVMDLIQHVQMQIPGFDPTELLEPETFSPRELTPPKAA